MIFLARRVDLPTRYVLRSLIRPLVLEPSLESLVDNDMTPCTNSALDLMSFQGHEPARDEPEAGQNRQLVSDAAPRVAKVLEPKLSRARGVTSSNPKASATPPKRAPARALPRAKARTFGRSMTS